MTWPATTEPATTKPATTVRAPGGLEATGATLPTPLGEIETEAALALTEAATSHVAARLLAQLNGALSRRLEQIEQIATSRPEQARRHYETLLAESRFGRHLTLPWRVVLSGPPNVGKSSLINRIVGYQRMVVYDQPGTTRDVVTSTSPLRGWPIDWSDTAGMRHSADLLEQEGVRRAQAARRTADLLLLVVAADELSDAQIAAMCERGPSAAKQGAEQVTEQQVTEKQVTGQGVEQGLAHADSSDRSPPTLLVVNKVDRRRPERVPAGALVVSAATGEGVVELLDAVATRLLAGLPPAVDHPLLFTERQVEAVRRRLAELVAT